MSVFYKYFLLLAVTVGIVSAASAFAQGQDESRFQEELNERDFDALREYLKSKRTLDIAEKACNLTISGDVRTEWRHLNEKCHGKKVRGGDATNRAGLPISRNDFDIECNLRFDYVAERTWAVAHLQYDNSAGVDGNGHPCGNILNGKSKKQKKHKCDEGRCEKCKTEDFDCFADPEGWHGSGGCSDLCLKKAYMGYNICVEGDSRFDIELGRRGNLYLVFDSKVQFLSRLDGILLKYDSSWESVADWYVHAAGFLVDERVNQFAWITEIGFLGIYDTGFDFKYSFIDWEKHGKNRCFAHNPEGFRFMNSQFTLAYNLDPQYLNRPVKFYGAIIWNHDGHSFWAHCKKFHGKNLAWYTGVLIGEVKKEGDWAVELIYQVVQARSIPDDDMAGIGRGNVLDDSFTSLTRRGNTNFRGWRLEGLYAVTDNITLDTIFEWTKADDNNIGGSHNFSKFELEAIYAF